MQPYFYTFSEFLAMGKHGAYVWSSWGLTIVAIIGFIIYSRYQRRLILKQITTQHARQQTRHPARRP